MARFHRTKLSLLAEGTLSSGKPGDILTASQAEALLQQPCQGSRDPGWIVVSSTIPRVERSHQLFWRWDRDGKFWRCLQNSEKPSYLQRGVRRMHRAAKRSGEMVRSLDLDTLDPEDRKSAAVASTIFAAAEIIASSSSQRTLRQLAGTKPATIDESQLLRIFLQ